eukprot:GHVS01075352.1.p2 GENE.GHVS01075352.1~~GHVS01075352.1.p2  ORF type:complete len:178 (+),score=34.38 GHVS01075352.1:998-1531(+)
MTVIMPDSPLQLQVYEKQWADNPEQLQDWIHQVQISKDQLLGAECSITLPFFKITGETVGGMLDIPKALKALGMKDLFDKAKCDLSNIDASMPLVVSDIVHQCTVEVDEQGTTASAATAAVINYRSLPVPGPVVVVDRPFLFQIRLRSSKPTSQDVVLFMGRVVDVAALQPQQALTS